MASNSKHQDRTGAGFGGVSSASANQSFQFGPHPVVDSMPETAFANANSVQVSSGIDDDSGRRASSSNPKASKKKTGYHQRHGIKKPRLLWVNDLQQHFLEIYNSLPVGKVYPKKILEKMRVKYPFVTRENIASHLQKHRLFLKKKNSKENSAKASSKSVPLKAPKESKPQPIHNITSNTIPNPQLLQTHFSSTNPNSQLLQSHFSSTNPNSQLLQSHFNSTNPNSQLLQSYFNSTNPNSQLLYTQGQSNSTNVVSTSYPTYPNSHLPRQKKADIKHETLLNHEVQYYFAQLNVSDHQAMMQQHSFFNDGHGGSNIYSNMENVFDSQGNINWAPAEQPSSSDPAYGNGVQLHPIMDYLSFEGLDNTCNDHNVGTLPNFPLVDYNMNFNYDNVKVDDGLNNNMYYSEALDFSNPLNFTAINY